MRAAVRRSQLLNACTEGAVDERVLNKPPEEGGSLSHQERSENARLFLDAARSVGCFLGDAAPDDITQRTVRALLLAACSQESGRSQMRRRSSLPACVSRQQKWVYLWLFLQFF